MLRSSFYIGRNPFAQFEISGHGCILVVAVHHGLIDHFPQCPRRIEIRKALAHVERSELMRLRAHFCKDGCANVGQLGFPESHARS